MPELPEVESIRNWLRHGKEAEPSILGFTISQVDVLWNRTVQQPDPDEFIKNLAGQQISEINRRGKYLIFILDAYHLLIHLKMSGDLEIRRTGQENKKHDRLIVSFDNDWKLAFNDTRKFGRAWLVTDDHGVIGNLGPEPFAAELSDDAFFQRLSQKHQLLKPLLLNQQFLAGLGNIYTDEALFFAGLHPLMRANEVSRAQSDRLLNAIRLVLKEGLEHHGASIDWVYRGGDFQNFFRVYGRTGKPCERCNTPIERIIIGQRSTHFCPNCQA